MSADKLAKIQAYIDRVFPAVDAELDEIVATEEDELFDIYDMSGGKVDEAYGIGEDHGIVDGKYQILSDIKEILDGEDE